MEVAAEISEMVAFVDDLCLVTLANDEEKLMEIVKEGFRMVAHWINA